MKMIQSLAIATVLALGGGAFLSHAEDTGAVNEVLRLKDAGVAEETIILFIQGQNKSYDLSAERVILLRDQGISPGVMNAMLQSGKAATVSPPAPAPAYAPEPMPQPAVPPVAAAPPALDQDVAYFHQELSPYGRWILSEENRWYWQPTVAVVNPDWRPYWDQGHWIYTDEGWYWSSDYPWGWAAFHYGRWSLHPHHGWIWYPDREWAPAWVTWRTGGDYCGWAPLPPYSHYDYVGGGLTFHGKRVEVGFDFGLAWNHFSFSYVRDLGDRSRPRFRKEADARRIYSQTTVINNYGLTQTVTKNEAHPRIVNRGIDPARVAAVRGKPVETVRIQDRLAPPPGRAPEHVDVRTKTLEVYRPRLAERDQFQRSSSGPASVARPGMTPSRADPRRVDPVPPQGAPGRPGQGSRSPWAKPQGDPR